MKVLIAEDDVILADILEEHLKKRGFFVKVCYDGDTAVDAASKEAFDLFLLDVNMPGCSGFEFLKTFRQIKNRTPAIFITSLQSSKELKYAFEIGANDYIKKPFELEELDARISYHLGTNQKNEEIKIGEETYFYPETNSIIKKKSSYHLSPKEAQILSYFAKNRGKTISYEELAYNIWGYDEAPSEATIRVYIKNLRKILGPERIKTIKKAGYLFECI
ncbi:response regulator transcription factor [Nitrosophilus alvini]|uniref:response regulator transcription factor n=1 Tax=Nitrosophilus alvini TaxID=2714855 RepID=UPI00190ABF44|nr:response regulator transcription factor [Nitrosophilus alvini]